MNDTDIWLQWWAFAWRHAHPHWPTLDVLPAEERSAHASASKTFGIAPCLPCPPTAALMQLALAPPSHYDALLQRVEHICRPRLPTALDATQRLWCQRLAWALRAPGWLEPADDVLQLLRAWLTPPVWQRVRLRFAPDRVEALEQQPLVKIAPAKLQTLWQAVLWHQHLVTDIPANELPRHADTPHT